MPQHDVSDAFDPSFWDQIMVVRQRDVVGTFGRTTPTTENTFTNVDAVIEPISPDDLNRDADYQTSSKGLSVITMFRLRVASPGYQADQVLFAGDTFVVKGLEDYSRYGQGFVRATCEAVDLLITPPTEDMTEC